MLIVTGYSEGDGAVLIVTGYADGNWCAMTEILEILLDTIAGLVMLGACYSVNTNSML